MNATMAPLQVPIAKVCRLGLIKDGKLGATKERAERIKKCLALVASK